MVIQKHLRTFSLMMFTLVCSGQAIAEPPPLKVIELFTSQGCSSCPPADALLSELSQEPDILALSYHINYWDYIGWKDPFASEESTHRQRAYNQALGRRNVFTPQMIVQGRYSAVGSRRSEVSTALKNAETKPNSASAIIEGSQLTVDATGSKPLDIWLINYQPAGRSNVTRGENRGHTLTHHNIVRTIKLLARHRGSSAHYTLPAATTLKQAIVIQEANHGSILAALKRN